MEIAEWKPLYSPVFETYSIASDLYGLQSLPAGLSAIPFLGRTGACKYSPGEWLGGHAAERFGTIETC